VRELRLRRRRSNVPWIYLVYHVDPKPPGGGGSPPASATARRPRRPRRPRRDYDNDYCLPLYP
jgi:hypothetical protein